MEQITTIAALIGKKIVRVEDQDRALLLVFADGTFAVFRIDHGYERSDTMIVLDDDDPELCDLRDWKLITADEYEQLAEKTRARQKAQEDAGAREAYERLKLRFEKKSP
jgi:hypothetical protein